MHRENSNKRKQLLQTDEKQKKAENTTLAIGMDGECIPQGNTYELNA